MRYMFYLRTLTFVGICCVIACAGLFLYLRYDTQRFAASLPQPPVLTNRTDQALEITPHGVNVSIRMDTVESAITANTIATQKRRSRLKNALSFDFTDRQTAYEHLETDLRAVYPDDPRVDRFLELWMTMSEILQATESYENEDDLETLLKMRPGATLKAFVEFGIELLQLNDTDATAVRAAAAHSADTIYWLQIATRVVRDIQDALNTGEMTLNEAKAFFADYDLDVDVEILRER